MADEALSREEAFESGVKLGRQQETDKYSGMVICLFGSFVWQAENITLFHPLPFIPSFSEYKVQIPLGADEDLNRSVDIHNRLKPLNNALFELDGKVFSATAVREMEEKIVVKWCDCETCCSGCVGHTSNDIEHVDNVISINVALKKFVKSESEEERKMALFFIAVIMNHELSHVICRNQNKATTPEKLQAPSSSKPEAGEYSEFHMFGGVMCGIFSRVSSSSSSSLGETAGASPYVKRWTTTHIRTLLMN
jgi:hypothetical protein